MSVEATPKLANILYACANGRLPWGVEWDTFLPLCGGLIDDETGEKYNGFVLCCGHTLNLDEAMDVMREGIMAEGEPDRFGRTTLTITDKGREFLAQHEHLVEFEA